MKMTTPRPSSKQRRREHIQRATASAAHTRDPQRTTSSAVKPFQRPPIRHNLQTPLSAASDNDGVAVGEARHADRDEETTNDKGHNATSNTNTRGESPTKRARAENPATSTQPEQSCHGSRTLRSDRARKPRALSQASISDTFKRVQVSGKSSSVTNQETDRGVSLSQAKGCSSTKR